MKRTTQRRTGTIAVLSLLCLIVVAAGAQAAFAAGSSTPAAGTEGRGGIDAARPAELVPATPAAGTEGRGGVAAYQIAAVASTPAAGTEGRGGVDAYQIAAPTPAAGTEGRGGVASFAGTLNGEPAVAANGFVSRARGGLPVPQAGSAPRAAVAYGSSDRAPWIALAVGGAGLLAGLFFWAASRRRAWQAQSSLAAFCTYNPSDSLCRAG